MRKKISFLALLVLAAWILPSAAYAALDITDSFADQNFLRLVRLSLGKNPTDPIYDTDVNTRTSLNVSSYGSSNLITSLEGIENFTALTELRCSGNSLTSLGDLPDGLTYLDCSRDNLTSLGDLPGGLTYLGCSGNNLTSLGELPDGLTYLDCSRNNLTSLGDLPGGLTDLNCSENNLTTSLGVLPNGLINLNCGSNALISLETANLTSLQELWCQENQLSSLNLTNLPSLQSLHCGENQISSLILGDLTSLKVMECNDNSITSLALKDLPDLTTLNCQNNELISLSLVNLPMLSVLDCTGNEQLTSLTLTDLLALKELVCIDSQLTTLNLSNLPALDYLNCSGNRLTMLDVSHLPALRSLSCQENVLTSLNVSGLTSLEYLDVYTNKLTTLDVSSLTSLRELECLENELTSLKLGEQSELGVVDCSSNALTELDISGLSSLHTLLCYNNQMDGESAIKGLDKESITYFYFEPQVTVTPNYYIFTSATVGYGAQPAHQFTIKNFGAAELTGLTATLRNGAETAFEIVIAPSSAIVPGSGGAATVSVTPKTGLPSGTHTDHLDITSDNTFESELSLGLRATLQFDVTAPTPTITIGTQPEDIDVVQGRITDKNLSVVASVTEGGGTLSYQWYSNATSSYEDAIPLNVTGTSLTIPGNLIEGTYYYFCKVSAPGAESVNSRIVAVKVLPVDTPFIAITTQPVNPGAFTVGNISGILSVAARVTVDGEPSDTQPTYQWFSNTTNSSEGGDEIGGAESASFTIPTTLTQGTYYYFCEVSVPGAESVRSTAATVTVNPAGTPVTEIELTTQPVNPEPFTVGNISGILSVAARVTVNGESSDTQPTYQWFSNTTNSSEGGDEIGGAESASFTIPTTLTQGTYYYFCEVSAPGAESVRSTAATVTVNPAGKPINPNDNVSINGEQINLDESRNGTGWSWNKDADELTIDGSIGNVTLTTDRNVKMILDGESSASSIINNGAGGLTITGGAGGKLTVNAADGKPAISAKGDIVINSGVVDASASGGKSAIESTNGSVTIEGTASVTAASSGGGSAIKAKNSINISTGEDVKATTDSGYSLEAPAINVDGTTVDTYFVKDSGKAYPAGVTPVLNNDGKIMENPTSPSDSGGGCNSTSAGLGFAGAMLAMWLTSKRKEQN